MPSQVDQLYREILPPMPELPEVETVRRIIEPHIVDRRIVGITRLDFPAVLDTTMVGADPISLLRGRQVIGTARRAKYLGLLLEDELLLIVHLRMTGRLVLQPTGADPIRFEHASIHLDDGQDLRFGDQRKFGRLTVATMDDWLALDARLGPEPDSSALTGRTLQLRLSRRPGPIKNALLDQHLIAGLGNIYVDEALYRSRIHPLQAANSLSESDCRRLLRSIRHVLNLALQNQGTTFSSFENPYGESGSNAAALRAYGRGGSGEPCDRCGTKFERLVVAGRGTSYCPTCQILRIAEVHR